MDLIEIPLAFPIDRRDRSVNGEMYDQMTLTGRAYLGHDFAPSRGRSLQAAHCPDTPLTVAVVLSSAGGVRVVFQPTLFGHEKNIPTSPGLPPGKLIIRTVSWNPAGFITDFQCS